jgi:transcriptional regulator with XRE-family HTH domain
LLIAALRGSSHRTGRTMKTVGEMVRNARDAKGFTQRDVADKVGVTPGFVAKIESNESLPGYSVCVALTNFLDLALDDLWTAVEATRRDADERRRKARGEVATGAIRTRGAVRVRGVIPTRGAAARGPTEIGREIASDPDLLTAYRNLRTALSDSSLRTTVLTTLEAWARMVESRAKTRSK